MKRVQTILLVLATASLFVTLSAVFAQTSTSSWPFFAEVDLNTGAPGMYDVVVPLQIMDKAREDLADLRLYDIENREIPYALRIRRQIAGRREVGVRVFNQATVGSSASEAWIDLGEFPGEHNEVEVQTVGKNFRRRVNVEGSDTGKEWRTLKPDGLIFRVETDARGVESAHISYPTSRYRFLRVRVFADEISDSEVPKITDIKVTMAVRQEGQLTSWNVPVPYYQLLRNQGAPASAWIIDLGWRVPCDRLALDVAEPSFSRPFYVEAIDDPQNPQLLASGELIRRVGEVEKPLVINFEAEQHVRKLRLLVTDHSNQTLTITGIQASAPARQLVFELKQQTRALPLRLFFGNPKIGQPHYDFEKELWGRSSAPITRITVGALSNNPAYVPEPLPLTERVPWLIYLVLGASSLALALILMSLARTTMRTFRQQGEEQPTTNETA